MKHLLAIFLAALCANTSAQTIRTLGYNSTNGQIVAATNVTWTNSFNFSTNTAAAQVRTNLLLGWSALTNSNAATSLLGFTTNGQVVATTGTNTLTFTNDVNFGGNMTISAQVISGSGVSFSFEDGAFSGSLVLDTNSSIAFQGASAAATRTNLSLGLPALTNTSNVTTMRALAGGSTNPNVPFSGLIEYHNHNADPWFMEISNGIILRIYE